MHIRQLRPSNSTLINIILFHESILENDSNVTKDDFLRFFVYSCHYVFNNYDIVYILRNLVKEIDLYSALLRV